MRRTAIPFLVSLCVPALASAQRSDDTLSLVAGKNIISLGVGLTGARDVSATSTQSSTHTTGKRIHRLRPLRAPASGDRDQHRRAEHGHIRAVRTKPRQYDRTGPVRRSLFAATARPHSNPAAVCFARRGTVRALRRRCVGIWRDIHDDRDCRRSAVRRGRRLVRRAPLHAARRGRASAAGRSRTPTRSPRTRAVSGLGSEWDSFGEGAENRWKALDS